MRPSTNPDCAASAPSALAQHDRSECRCSRVGYSRADVRSRPKREEATKSGNVCCWRAGRKLVVPYAPGGASDALDRVAAEKMTTLLGQQVIVENKAGGNTIIGMDALPKAEYALSTGTNKGQNP